MVAVGIYRDCAQFCGQLGNFYDSLSFPHDQASTPGAQGNIQLDYGTADELDAPVGGQSPRQQRVKDVTIEEEDAGDTRISAQCLRQRGMVKIAQVTTEPDEGQLTGRTGISGDFFHADRLQCAHTMSTAKSIESACLANHFLIAMPAMADPNFSRTLTYVCEHNAEGALGIIINRPLDLSLGELFERVNIPLNPGDNQEKFGSQPVFYGGPVQTDRGFVLHRPLGLWQATLNIGDALGLTSSRDILQSMSEDGRPADVLVSLGYAGWSAGQLEWELSQNAWLTVAADPEIIFALPPDERLTAAMHLLGVDFANLSEVAGHA